MAGASSGASLCSFTTVIGTPAVLRVLVLIYCFVSLNKLVKCFWKQWERKTIKLKNIALLSKCKLNSIEKVISKTLLDSSISHEEFMLGINGEQNCLRLKENISRKDRQLSDIERDKLIGHVKRIGIDEILKQNGTKSLELKSEV